MIKYVMHLKSATVFRTNGQNKWNVIIAPADPKRASIWGVGCGICVRLNSRTKSASIPKQIGTILAELRKTKCYLFGKKDPATLHFVVNKLHCYSVDFYSRPIAVDQVQLMQQIMAALDKAGVKR